MSRIITQELEASGVAQVIVVLRRGSAATDRPAAPDERFVPDAEVGRLEQHFRSSELSHDAALAVSEVTPQGAIAPAIRYYPHLGVALGVVDRAGLAALRADPQVASVQGAPGLSLIKPARVATAALGSDRAWGLEALGAPQLWDRGYTGRGVLVGHLDTGVDGTHPSLQGAVRAFAEFDMLGFERRPAPTPHDTGEHGTHTAATIAGRPVGRRCVGMAPEADLASAIVIEGGNTVARVLGGMDWAIEQGVRILSMSLGFRGWWQDFIPITRILREHGVLPVFAVGNEGPGTSRSPGNYPQALSVGAVAADHLIAPFSSSQQFQRRRDSVVPDLVAPGVSVTSAKPGGGWQQMDGTSMATPHIAGLAALLIQARPEASVARIEQAIFKSCSLGPTMTPDRAHRGFPDGLRALAILSGSTPASRGVPAE